MLRRSPQFRVLQVLTLLALVSSICGASPQEGKVPRPQPVAPKDPSPPPPPVPPRSMGNEGRLGRPHPGPTQRSLDPQRPTGGLRLSNVNLSVGTGIVVPPPWKRRLALPDRGYWQHRDLMAEIQWLSRRGFIPVTPLGDGVETVADFVQQPAGWRAYGIAVPPGGTLQVEVQHEKLGWFRLMLTDKWGTPGPGMLHAATAHQPVRVTYKNPGKEATAVYVIVDDPAWWSAPTEPYSLHLRRDWDPAVDLSEVKMAAGLWGASPSVSAQFRRPSMSGPAVYPR